jgi:hypothetical protein
MTPDLPLSGADLLVLVGRGALLYLALHGVRTLLELVRLRPRTKARLERVVPLVSLAAWLGFAALTIHELLGAQARAAAWVLASLLVACVLALWGPIRDVLTGVFLRASGAVGVGDDLTLGELRGHVEELGHRRVLLRTSRGEALVPYSELAKGVILRAQSERRVRSHTFRVRPVAGLAQAELRRAIKEAALLSHWSCPARPPELVSAEQGALEVTVFAIAEAYGPELERAVRARLAEVEGAPANDRLLRVPEITPARGTHGDLESSAE